RAHPTRNASSRPMKYGDEREQPPRRIEVEGHLIPEALHQKLRALVMQPAPSHVDRLDLARCRGADRLVIALAHEEIILHQATERRERQVMRDYRLVILRTDIEDEPIADHL